jgi:hypothetical protein
MISKSKGLKNIRNLKKYIMNQYIVIKGYIIMVYGIMYTIYMYHG